MKGLCIWSGRQPAHRLKGKTGPLHIQRKLKDPNMPSPLPALSFRHGQGGFRLLRKACQHAQTSVQKIAAVLPGPGAAVAGDLPASLLSHFKAGISLCCAGEASSASINL